MMSHRLMMRTVVGLVALTTGAGCPSDPTPSPCDIERHRIEGTTLTLLSDARMDAVGDQFVLLGTDGSNVHWAALTRAGVIGDQHFIAVPPHVGRPWFAVAGTDAPADHVVIAYVPAGKPDTGPVDVMTFSVRFDNTAPSTSTLFGQIPAAATVAMSSGRGGMHAAMTWGVSGTAKISARLMGGDGQAIGAELNLGTPGIFDCLRFSPGKGDVTVGYVDLSGTPPRPSFVVAEITAGGVLEPPFRVQVGSEPPSCVELAPSDTGYGLAWHSRGIGTFFGVFTPLASQFASSEILPDVRVRGVPPGLGGLGWLGKNDYAVVFARPTGAEVWPVNATGDRQGFLPVFPSMAGETGVLSTQPIGTTLYATYADYAQAGDRTQGIRFLVKLSCP